MPDEKESGSSAKDARMQDDGVIRFTAIVARIQTMADGGLRFTFDVGETETLAAVQLMECKRLGAVLEISAIAKVEDERDTGKPAKIHI